LLKLEKEGDFAHLIREWENAGSRHVGEEGEDGQGKHRIDFKIDPKHSTVKTSRLQALTRSSENPGFRREVHPSRDVNKEKIKI